MSAKVLGLVLEYFPARDAQELAIAVILADAADHDGSHVFPSVTRVARLARTSERTVQRALATFRDAGFLIVKQPGGGRGRSTKHEIDIDWLLKQSSVLSQLQKGDQLSPFDERVTDSQKKGDKRVTKGCHSYVTQPVYPYTRLPTTTTADPPEVWLEAVEVEVEAARKLRTVVNEDGLRASILKRYRENQGPGPGALKALEARRRAVKHHAQSAPDNNNKQVASKEVARAHIESIKRTLHSATA